MTSHQHAEFEYDQLRMHMVKNQIINRGIKSRRVLKALQVVPRHRFVPTELHESAYNDSPLPIGYLQTISQPYIVALMTEMLQVEKEHDVLEIGTGSGYQTAIISLLARQIVSVEIIPELHERASRLLLGARRHNIDLRCGDAFSVLQQDELFDRIIVTAAAKALPESLISKLKPAGRMVIPVGCERQILMTVQCQDGTPQVTRGPGVRFVPITGDCMSDPPGNFD